MQPVLYNCSEHGMGVSTELSCMESTAGCVCWFSIAKSVNMTQQTRRPSHSSCILCGYDLRNWRLNGLRRMST